MALTFNSPLNEFTYDHAMALRELEAACRESVTVLGHDGWVKTRDLSGTREQRSTRMMHWLVWRGYAQGNKWGTNKQSQWSWRITETGKSMVESLNEQKDQGLLDS